MDQTLQPTLTPTPTPPASPLPHAKTIIFVAILIGIFLLLFIAPIPYYQSEEVSCKPGQTNCPRIGWQWNKSLYQSFMGYVQYSSRSQISQVDTPTPMPLPSEAPTEGDTANWKTYTDKKYGFSFSLPEYYQTENKSWSTIESVNFLSISPQPGEYPGCCFKKSDPISIQSKAISMEADQNIGIKDWKIKSGFATSHKFIKENIINENGLSFTIFTALNFGQKDFIDDDRLTGFIIQKDSTLIIISVNHYRENQNEAELFINQILSTFKFTGATTTPTLTITPTPKPKTTYTAPTSWKRFTTQSGVNLCLPPKWEVEAYDHLIFNRDEGYKPSITYITNLPYSGGSRREAYFAYWANEYPEVKQLVSVTDTDINGNSALTIYPANSSDPKTSPEGLTVVWYSVGKLWKAGLSGWNMTNTSQTSFLKDFYTMISCSL